MTFTVNANANSLAVGTSGPFTITFTNADTGQGTQTRTATLTVNAPVQFYPSLVGSYEGGSFTNIFFGRGDYQINSKQNLFYRYINQHTEFFCSGCGGKNACRRPSRRTSTSSRARARPTD